MRDLSLDGFASFSLLNFFFLVYRRFIKSAAAAAAATGTHNHNRTKPPINQATLISIPILLFLKMFAMKRYFTLCYFPFSFCFFFLFYCFSCCCCRYMQIDSWLFECFIEFIYGLIKSIQITFIYGLIWQWCDMAIESRDLNAVVITSRFVSQKSAINFIANKIITMQK